MTDDPGALAERQRRKALECSAGPDLHRELLPPGHPLAASVPLRDDHPLREQIAAAQAEHAEP
ncbi:MAG TPA: hypothetical protein VG476_04820 [Acidimicrobiales bacterium]|nr:hypothetical protein [Acidimicrobiales bacterium]